MSKSCTWPHSTDKFKLNEFILGPLMDRPVCVWSDWCIGYMFVCLFVITHTILKVTVHKSSIRLGIYPPYLCDFLLCAWIISVAQNIKVAHSTLAYFSSPPFLLSPPLPLFVPLPHSIPHSWVFFELKSTSLWLVSVYWYSLWEKEKQVVFSKWKYFRI